MGRMIVRSTLATAVSVRRMPRPLVHSGGCSIRRRDRHLAEARRPHAARCRPLPESQRLQAAVRAARHCDLSRSVRGGGHDRACRPLCNVIDVSSMRGVAVADNDNRAALISGGAWAADVLAVTDPLDVAAATDLSGRASRCYLRTNDAQSSRLLRRASSQSARNLPWMSEDTRLARSMRTAPSLQKSICRSQSNPARSTRSPRLTARISSTAR